jgi:hypothetical protein
VTAWTVSVKERICPTPPAAMLIAERRNSVISVIPNRIGSPTGTENRS